MLLAVVMSGCLGLFGPKVGQVSGTVTWDDDTPIAGATVKVADQTATTNANGAYVLTKIKHGTHHITVTLDGKELAKDNVTIGKDALTKNIEVPKPVEPAKQGVISGSVKRENDDAVEDATVSVDGKDVSAKTDAEGKFTLPKLDYGNYKLVVTLDAEELGSKTVELDAEAVTVAITVPNEVVPTPKGVISGTVSYATEGVVKGATVSVLGEDDTTATTDDDGKYSLPELEHGEYTLVVTLAGVELGREDVDLDDDVVTANITVGDPVPATGVISGTVKYKTEGNIVGAIVSVEDEDEASSTTDADGKYTLPALPFGDYRLIVKLDDDEIASEEVTLSEAAKTVDFVVEDPPAEPELLLVYEEDFSGPGASPEDYRWVTKTGWDIVEADEKRWIQASGASTSNNYIAIPDLANADKVILEYTNFSSAAGAGWGTSILANNAPDDVLGGKGYFVFRRWNGLGVRMQGMGGTDLEIGTGPVGEEFTIRLTYDRTEGTIHVLRDDTDEYSFDLQPSWLIEGEDHVFLNLYINGATTRWTDLKVWVQ